VNEFKHRHIEVPFLDQTHAHFDEWDALIKKMDAERAQDARVIVTTAPRNATWCNYCAAYIRPDGLKSYLRKACEHKETKP
jgi:hypothetical protein